MYEERRAFPTKWVIIAAAVIILVVGVPLYINYKKNAAQKAFDDVIARIEAAGKLYGDKEITRLRVLEKTCLTLDLLMKENYLDSDSEDEFVIYNPNTKEKMNGQVEVSIKSRTGREQERINSKYQYDKKCEVDYQDKIKLVIDSKNTHSFVAKIDADQKALGLNSFEYKLDDGKSFKHDVNEYTFDELVAGKYKVIVKTTDFLGQIYERQAVVEIDPLIVPELVYSEEEKSVTVVCPNEVDESISCTYTTDNESWLTVDEENKKYVFESSGTIIARATDGYNVTADVSKEVTVIPVCVNETWGECTGCEAGCDQKCNGTQTSSCGNTRPCEIIGYCGPKYTVNLNVVNGKANATQFEVTKGYTKIVTVIPNTGYKYSNVVCDNGVATYSTSTSELTIKSVTSARNCTVTFTKIAAPVPTSYKVNFNGIDGKLITTKTVKAGLSVTPIDAPAITGYTFISWVRNGLKYDFNSPVNSNITLTANYVSIKYTVAFNSAGGSSLANQYIASGSKAYKPNNPYRTAYHFMYWSESGKVYDFNSPVNQNITLVANWAPLISKSVAFDGTTINHSVFLSNYKGIHEVTSNCPNNFTYSMSGSSININLNRQESCVVTVSYY